MSQIGHRISATKMRLFEDSIDHNRIQNCWFAGFPSGHSKVNTHEPPLFIEDTGAFKIRTTIGTASRPVCIGIGRMHSVGARPNRQNSQHTQIFRTFLPNIKLITELEQNWNTFTQILSVGSVSSAGRTILLSV